MARRWLTVLLIALSLTIMVAWFALGHSLSASADAGQTERVSVSSSGVQGNLASGWTFGFGHASVSSNGRYVAFHANATNLVSGDTNNASDVFVRDRQTGQTTRVSVSSSSAQANGPSESPAISADGRYVAFASSADNLVAGDTNDQWDVFVHDRQTGQTQRVSLTSVGVQGNDSSIMPAISGDGRIVVFQSMASNLDPLGAVGGIFTHDRQTGQTTLVSVASDGLAAAEGYEVADPTISADGRFVAFSSLSGNLIPDDYFGYWDVFVHDRQTGVTEIVSVSSQGGWGNDDSTHPALSDDGRYVAFYSEAFTLAAAGRNIFVHDRQTGQTSGVDVSSLGVKANQLSVAPDISGDGRYVVFQSEASNLVDGDTATCLNAYDFPVSCADIFFHDRQTGQTERVSIDSAGAQGNEDSFNPAISADGRVVVFDSAATNLVPGDTNDMWDVFVHVRDTGGSPTATATGSPTASATPTKTPTPTVTPTNTNTPAPTSTATVTATSQPTATATNPPPATATPTKTPVPPPTAVPQVYRLYLPTVSGAQVP